MNSIFPWLDRLFEALLAFFPRPINVRSTQRLVVFRFGMHREFRPGWRWIWPLIESAQIIEVVDAVAKMDEQPGLTKDGLGVTIDALIVFDVPDALRAVTMTTDYAAMMEAALWPRVRSYVASRTLAELTEDLGGEAVDVEMAHNTKRRLRQRYGVRVKAIQLIVARSKVLHHVGKAWG